MADKKFKPTVGRIIHYYPGSNDIKKLPNGMEFCPAIIVQVFNEDSDMPQVNAVGFVAARQDQGWHDPYFSIWSASEGKKEYEHEGETKWPAYWVWPPMV